MTILSQNNFPFDLWTLNNAAVNVLKTVDQLLWYQRLIYGSVVKTTHCAIAMSNIDLLFDCTLNVKFGIHHHKDMIVYNDTS